MTTIEQLKKSKNIYDIKAVKLTSCIGLLKKRCTSEVLREITKNSRLINVYDITYRSQGHKVKGFIVEPKKPKGKLPCIIYNRGGSGEFGAIKIGETFLRLGRFAKWGYIVIASQYSGNAGSEGKDEVGGSDIEDVLNLKKILKNHLHADEKRIGMFGISRGGMMTYLSLARVKWLKAAVSIAGPTNFKREEKLRPDMKRRNKMFFGGSKKALRDRSAVYWTDKFTKKTPLLMLHGTADWRVSPLDSLDLAEKLYENKVPYRLIMYEGADHGLSEVREEAMLEVRKWFDKYLKNNGKLPDLKPHDK